MKANLYKTLFRYMPLCMGLMVLNSSCEDDLQVGKKINESGYNDIYENRIFVRDSKQNQSAPIVELYGEKYQTSINVCLSKAATNTTTATLKIDAEYLAAYNEEHQTDFELYPSKLITFAEEGKVTFSPGSKNTEIEISIAGGPEIQENKTYALPVTVSEMSEDLSTADTPSSHCMYLIKDMRNASNAYKGEDKVKGFLFIEVNDVNPLNALSFQLENGKYLWDAVVLFAANINYDSEAGRPFVNCNPNVQYLLDNNERFLQPLRKRGIKVLLGLLGNHDMAGLAQLSRQGAKDFARELAQYCKAYNLDGVNFDDEWSDPNPDVNNPAFTYPSYEAGARLCLETKRAMPDKLVTVFQWGKIHSLDQVDGVMAKDYTDIAVPNYGSAAVPLGGMSRKQCAGLASEYNINRGQDLSPTTAQRLIEGGYGWFMGFAPFPNNYERIWRRLTGATTLYGCPLKKPSIFYKKNMEEPFNYPNDL